MYRLIKLPSFSFTFNNSAFSYLWHHDIFLYKSIIKDLLTQIEQVFTDELFTKVLIKIIIKNAYEQKIIKMPS